MPRLFSKNPVFVTHAIAFVALWASSCAIGWTEQSLAAWQVPESQIVVLKNRQTFSGNVTQSGDKVSVALPSGSVIVFQKSKVMLVAESLSSAYWELAARTRSTDLSGQIQVFKWCVNNGQFDEASNHLLMLQEMDIPAQQLMQLDVSLEIAQTRFRQSEAALATSSLATQSQPVSQPSPSNQSPNAAIAAMESVEAIKVPDLNAGIVPPVAMKRLPRLPTPPTEKARSHRPITIGAIDQYGNEVDSSVQQVSWEHPIDDSAKPFVEKSLPSADESLVARLRVTESLTHADLDRLTRSMPKGAIGVFRKQVEPLLQHACSACHRSGQGDRSFEIYQSVNGSINRRMSQKNLYQALNLSDQQQAEASLLIRYATTAHGSQRSASFDFADAQLLPLKRWLIMISENPFLPVHEFSNFAPDGTTAKADPIPKALSTEITSEDFAGNKKTVLPTPSPVEALDPFDANLFNQKFLPRVK
jgi:hypothetical protein